ncbi:ABC transporter permease subunit [Microbacterium sp. RD1]|uniref:ABC transporter permease subunit n=1 Tax=Microbacterium sp. RD1 TaxID=3457313 RepID=UPI003FA5D805
MNLILQALIGGLAFGAIYAIAGVTFGVIYRVTKVFHLAFGAIGTLGAYVAVSMSSDGSIGSVLGGLLLGMVVAGVVTALVVALVYQPMVRRGADAGITFVASLALSFILQSGVLLAFGPGNRSFPLEWFVRQQRVGPFGISWSYVSVVAVALIVTALIALAITRTRAGHQYVAVSSSAEQAEIVGIRGRWVEIAACAAAAAVSVIAFWFVGVQSSVIASGGTQLTLLAVLAVLAGGAKSVWGTSLVGFAIGMLSALAASVLPGEWSLTVVFVIVVALVLAKPGGIARNRLKARA